MNVKTIDIGTSKLLAAGALAVVAAGIGLLLLVRGGQAERWQRHEETAFSLEAPKSWHVAEAAGRVTVAGANSEEVVIWPFFSSGALADERAHLVTTSLASKVVPGVTWTDASAPRPGVVRLEGESSTTKVVAVLLYQQSRTGTAGSLYVTAAPENEFDGEASTFAHLLDSFEARGAPVVKQRAQRFEEWTDPVEGAFSVKVPEGWSTSGGTDRPSTLLVQATAATTSPDSAITALMTDAFPVYVEPSPVLEFGGIYEGGTYVDAAGYSSPVRRYAPGARYVSDYILPGHVPNARITRFRDLPSVARQLATYGISSYDVGEIEYRFTRNGVPYTGGGLCVTEKISTGGYVAWHVWRLYLAEAPSARYGEGLTALDRLAGSLRIDPGWAARQSETTRQQSGIITQMSNDIGDTLSSGYWGRQQVYDALFERRSKATLEVEDLTDENGNTFRVDSGSNYYWLDPRGTIVGTNTDTRPDVDFSELVGVDG